MVKSILLCLCFFFGFMVYASSPAEEPLDDQGLSYELVDCVKTIADLEIVMEVKVNNTKPVHKLTPAQDFTAASSGTYTDSNSLQLEYPVGYIRTYEHSEKPAIVKKNFVRTGFRRFYSIAK